MIAKSFPHAHFLCSMRFDIKVCWTSADGDGIQFQRNPVMAKWIPIMVLKSILLRVMRSSISAESAFSKFPSVTVLDRFKLDIK